MMIDSRSKSDALIISLRKIMRAIDLHSKQLVRKYGLTGPQMLVLKAIHTAQHDAIHSSQLANRVSLSLATVTTILDRLSEKGYIERVKSTQDRRKTFVVLTEKAQMIMQSQPTLLQEDFVHQFEQLKEWEQSLLVSSCERIAEMMQAKAIDAGPVLSHAELHQESE